MPDVFAANRAYLRGWDPTHPPDGDLVIYRSGVAHPPLNGVVRSRGVPVEEAIAEARRRLAGVPWTWWVGPDSSAGLADELLARGATEVFRLPVMTIDLDRVDFAVPDGVRIGPADDVTEFVTAYSKVSHIHDVPRAVERESTLDVLRFEARVDGFLAATAVGWLSHGVTTVYLVGTHPDYRRRGIGTAVTAAALVAGRERGLRLGALTASAMGEAVYRRMGFTTVAHYRLLAV
ncbi:GNAT family N-acetyltransferase [Kutzneria buriramensis]|uniref:Acetyltransferase (GNAT) family protein n=1 Tax=Kutzneria buriramensis TaxID=1045776 RepID=A0A3E0GXF9_9PSEU|nr:GNAT family N-acetyltransferase [Kutzneria buriramensis]REH33071.1 acetyltransferase (GNAT) family protein [Kutzneria buriramensis]